MEKRKANILTERLPFYLVGVAIGLVLVGVLQQFRPGRPSGPPAVEAAVEGAVEGAPPADDAAQEPGPEPTAVDRAEPVSGS